MKIAWATSCQTAGDAASASAATPRAEPHRSATATSRSTSAGPGSRASAVVSIVVTPAGRLAGGAAASRFPQASAIASTNGSFKSASACSGTVVRSRLPTVTFGIG